MGNIAIHRIRSFVEGFTEKKVWLCKNANEIEINL